MEVLSPEPTPEILEAYRWCRESNTPEHGNCVPLVPVAFAAPHEVVKHHDRCLVVDYVRGLPNWLNEGLAVYMSHRDRSKWYVESEMRRCREAGYVDINEFTGGEAFVP